jgi:hypothetical protein
MINLNTVTQTIMQGQDMTGLTISYFNTAVAAQQNILASLPNQFYNTIPNFQNVYVRITNTIIGCQSTSNVTLIANMSPTPLVTIPLAVPKVEREVSGLFVMTIPTISLQSTQQFLMVLFLIIHKIGFKTARRSEKLFMRFK